MNIIEPLALTAEEASHRESLFTLIADDIERQGYSIRPGALPPGITEGLLQHQQSLNSHMYLNAGVGRGRSYVQTEFVRTDDICWINGDAPAGRDWLNWTGALQQYLNRRLLLGLFSFESHFAHYAPGAYYKRHYDAFRGDTNRILSIVVYLNSGWTNDDGGELVLYADDRDRDGIRVVPLYGTIALFLSEEFPHEVRPANRDRYSVAGWYRVNTSIQNCIDPPR